MKYIPEIYRHRKMNRFRDFFEHYIRIIEPLGPKDVPQDILNDFNSGFLKEQRKAPPDDSFSDDNFNDTNGPVDFMSEVEEMFNNFFKGFPVMAFPLQNGDEIQSLHEHQGSSENRASLQERMLNDKKGETFQGRHPPSLFPFLFDGLRRPEIGDHYGSETKKEDRDLDEDFRKGDKNLDDILPRSENQPKVRPPSTFSFSSSSVTRNRNGVVETKKTVKDSSGNEEVTITRKVDGKEYTISHRQDQYGNKETREDVDKEKTCLGILTPESLPINGSSSSLYDRSRRWFNNEKD